MIKVNVKRNNVVTNSATFNTELEAEAWLNQEIQHGSFGKSERWVQDSTFQPLSQEEKDSALETREVIDREGLPEIINGSGVVIQEEVLEIKHTEYLLPADYTIESEDLGNAPLMEELRQLRNSKLSECDWTQLEDAPISSEKKQEFVVYRQALRDLPQLENLNVNNPQWPTKPSE